MATHDRVGTNIPGVTIEIETGPQGVEAVYFRFKIGDVAKTLEAEEPDVLVDLDSAGCLLGVELINPASVDIGRVLKNLARRFKKAPMPPIAPRRLKKLEELIAV